MFPAVSASAGLTFLKGRQGDFRRAKPALPNPPRIPPEIPNSRPLFGAALHPLPQLSTSTLGSPSLHGPPPSPSWAFCHNPLLRLPPPSRLMSPSSLLPHSLGPEAHAEAGKVAAGEGKGSHEDDEPGIVLKDGRQIVTLLHIAEQQQGNKHDPGDHQNRQPVAVLIRLQGTGQASVRVGPHSLLRGPTACFPGGCWLPEVQWSA